MDCRSETETAQTGEHQPSYKGGTLSELRKVRSIDVSHDRDDAVYDAGKRELRKLCPEGIDDVDLESKPYGTNNRLRGVVSRCRRSSGTRCPS